MGIPRPVYPALTHTHILSHPHQSSTMGKMKLTYFGVRARGEISRLVLAHSKTDYEFEERTFQDWAELKPKIPGGSLPVLEIDGKMFGQGIAIQTYLADIGGLMGDSAMDRFKINEISLVREDMLVPETQHFLCDDKEKAEKEKNLKEAHYPKFWKISLLGTLLLARSCHWLISSYLKAPPPCHKTTQTFSRNTRKSTKSGPPFQPHPASKSTLQKEKSPPCKTAFHHYYYYVYMYILYIILCVCSKTLIRPEVPLIAYYC